MGLDKPADQRRLGRAVLVRWCLKPGDQIVIGVGQLPDPATALVAHGLSVTEPSKLGQAPSQATPTTGARPGLPDVRAGRAFWPAGFELGNGDRRILALESAARIHVEKLREIG